MFAVGKGNKRVVKLLLAREDVDINSKDKDGRERERGSNMSTTCKEGRQRHLRG